MNVRLSRIMSAQIFGFVLAPILMGATSRTPNFVVTAPTPEIATRVAQAAEQYRKQLALEWVGYELPRWAAPCPVKVKVGQLGAGGATTFSFFPNKQGSAEVCNWDMQIQGSLERILDSVLPHEVSHTIFACHFRRPLPRWADEGAATLAEHESEKRRQVLTVRQVINTRRRIPLKNLMNIKEYPSDMQDVMTLYAEGYSLAELLVQQGGRQQYLKFLEDAHEQGWDKALQVHYGYRGVDDLERRWHNWIVSGGLESEAPQVHQFADAKIQRPPEKAQPIVRGQSPAKDPFLDEPALAMAEGPHTHVGSSLSAPEPREKPLRKRPLVAAPAAEAKSVEVSETVHESPSAAADSDDRAQPIAAAPKTDKSPRTPRKKKSEMQLAEARNSAVRRQVTEWSEFPQDPRPSPLILPGRNRSVARP